MGETPAAATSKRCARFLGRLRICVMAPKVPSCPLGMKNGGESATPRNTPATWTSTRGQLAQRWTGMGWVTGGTRKTCW